MINKPAFWIANMVALLAFYGVAIALAVSGSVDHWVVRLAAIFLAAHVLEIPLALKATRERQPALPKLLVATFLFGLVWWVPVKRGVLPA